VGTILMTRLAAASPLARAPSLGAVASPRMRASLLGFVLVASLAASDGGYWPTAWSWTTLACSWIAVLALVLAGDIGISWLQWLFVGLLAALAAWTLASVTWSLSASQSVLEAERLLAYLALAVAAILVVRSRSSAALLGGVWAAISLVSAYALATRLFPDRLGVFDAAAEYRLSEPVGYWNALGILAGVGAVLALGLAARARTRELRFAAAASLLALLPTMYFTFSRGAWVAAAIGVVACIALDPRRLQFVATSLALAPACALGLGLAYGSDALTHRRSALTEAAGQGHRLALILFALAIANGLIALALPRAARLVAVPPAARRAVGGALVLVAVALVAAVVVRFGGPTALVDRAQAAFAAPSPALEGNLNRRLFNFSGSGRVTAWRVARDGATDHPWLGTGAGSFEVYWLENRPYPMKIRDAHSLYLETWSEMGPFGLALLAAVVAVPVAAAVRARRSRLVPPAFGAFVAYFVHAGIDWDWEMTALTGSALLCGVAILVAAARDKPAMGLRLRWMLGALALVLAVAGFVGVNGNRALADAQSAASAGRFADSEARAQDAMTWMPWSSEPWQTAAEAQIAQRDFPAARESLRTALDKDPDSWELWRDLFYASTGRVRRKAGLRALRLNPHAPELAEIRDFLGVEEPPVLRPTAASG
jgi:O-antigen ligase